jgi:hypothetical protein
MRLRRTARGNTDSIPSQRARRTDLICLSPDKPNYLGIGTGPVLAGADGAPYRSDFSGQRRDMRLRL